ncbi:MAG: FAD-dependent oxidoreductase [Eubacteriales bacterium]|nr:FAD-dependent oxidoreductase [Eubacteriales bacterium]
MRKYDVIIIGSGIAGIFAGYELVSGNKTLKVAIIEQGADITRRSCPIVDKKTEKCINCRSCGIMRGFGGAGAFSDGKFNFTTEFGGWLNEYLPDRQVMELIEYVDAVNVKFGATEEVYSTFTPEADKIRRKALGFDLHLLDARCKHLGTERNRELLTAQSDWLKDRLELICNTKVISIDKSQNECNGFVLETSSGEFWGDYLIAAPGRSGAEWFSGQCKRLSLDLINNQVDIGVRVEVPAAVYKDITDAVYEAKLQYRTKQYKDLVRTFCMNPYGYVVTENTDGIITVNGHSYDDPGLQSQNTNFALLVSNKFTSPFKEPYQYGKRIATLSNLLGGGVIVQRFGDLIDGRRTNEHRLNQGFIQPTLDATPGDLSLVLPKRHLDNIMEMIYMLDKLAPGTANHDTLLYGVEVKFYSSRLELNSEFETKIPKMYAVGDGAGITRGLSQAAASGVAAARSILSKE